MMLYVGQRIIIRQSDISNTGASTSFISLSYNFAPDICDHLKVYELRIIYFPS